MKSILVSRFGQMRLTEEKKENIAGVDHIGIGLPNFSELVENYGRLKAAGIMPFMPVNHRFTTSLYYEDPDGAKSN